MKKLRFLFCLSLVLFSLAACVARTSADYDHPAASDPDICVGEHCSCESY